MRSVLVAVMVVMLGLTGAVKAAKTAESKTYHHTVVVPEDHRPFTVGQKDVIRLTGTVPSGGTIEARHTGKVRLVAENTITRVKNGGIIIGVFVKEFDYRPTGKGKVRVTITTKGPVPGSSPVETVYEFDV